MVFGRSHLLCLASIISTPAEYTTAHNTVYNIGINTVYTTAYNTSYTTVYTSGIDTYCSLHCAYY